MVGGILSSGSITNQLYEYDAITNNWTQKSNYPEAQVYAAASFSLNGKKAIMESVMAVLQQGLTMYNFTNIIL